MFQQRGKLTFYLGRGVQNLFWRFGNTPRLVYAIMWNLIYTWQHFTFILFPLLEFKRFLNGKQELLPLLDVVLPLLLPLCHHLLIAGLINMAGNGMSPELLLTLNLIFPLFPQLCGFAWRYLLTLLSPATRLWGLLWRTGFPRWINWLEIVWWPMMGQFHRSKLLKGEISCCFLLKQSTLLRSYTQQQMKKYKTHQWNLLVL